MLEVYLVKQDAASMAKLSLPAADYELLDALERAGIINGQDNYNVEVTSCKLEYLQQFIPDNANLYELNLLAKQLTTLGQWEMECFGGMVMMEAIKSDFAPVSVERLINMTHSVGNCQIARNVYDDKQLGRFYVENDFPVIPENLPEEAYELLNYEEIGKQARSSEGGVFTQAGYVVHSGEMSRQYSSENVTYPQKPEYVFLLEISTLPQGDEPNDRNCVTLRLPYTEEILQATLFEIGTDSIEGCCFYKYESTIPQLAEAFGFLEDIGVLNQLATTVMGWREHQRITYKAMLETAPKDITISEALELSEQIQHFSVIREATSPSAYAKHMLSKYCLPLQEELFSNANLERYGAKLMEENGVTMTDYGALWSMDGQTVEQCLNREYPAMEMGM